MILSNSKNTKNGFAKKYIFSGRNIIIILLVALIWGGYTASNLLQTKDYSGLWDFITTVSSNYWNGRNAESEHISIEIKDKDFKKLEKNRQQALERGVIINDLDGEYVPATLAYQDKKIKVKLRLKGHMTDHLQENKWSFRIKVKDKDSFMGMKRFSIQHPGTRGYIYEWIYHELMKREDIIALRYKFINVSVNGKDWGIYAVEENFEEDLIENNKRLKGPIIRFNPDMYWVNRYNMMKRQASYDEFASYYSANPEAYREDKILDDSLQRNYYLKGMALIEGVRNKKIPVDAAFDIERLAKFHAIIDLVGGQHSIDWSDIKYYYNPVTGKFEPVAYESFTNFPIRELSGMYKYIESDSGKNFETWHSALFSNPAFFRSYVKQLERISSTTYLDSFFNDPNEELKKNLAILNKEFPYKKFDKQTYYRNQLMIRKMLDTPRAFHTYLSKTAENKIYLQFGSIESLPSEIKSLQVGTTEIKPSESIVLPAKQPNAFVTYHEYAFTVPPNIKWNNAYADSLEVIYSILGSSMNKKQKVYSFPHTDESFIASDIKNKQATINNFPFLIVDDLNKIITIKPGEQLISSDLIIPAGFRVIASEGTSIDLQKGAKIISYSPLFFSGNEESPIIIKSSDSSGQGLVLTNALKSIFNYVHFENFPKIKDDQWARSGTITVYETPVEFNHCKFLNNRSKDAISIIRSDFKISNCLFNNIINNAVDIDFSKGMITNSVFENCSRNAIDVTTGILQLRSIYIHSTGKAFCIKNNTQLKARDIKINGSAVAISAENGSSADIQNITISDSNMGLAAAGSAPSVIQAAGLTLKNVKKPYLKEKKSDIKVNGSNVGEQIENIETSVKSEKKENH